MLNGTSYINICLYNISSISVLKRMQLETNIRSAIIILVEKCLQYFAETARKKIFLISNNLASYRFENKLNY